jgi:hypothetical protein
LPAFPSDGGRILRALLARKRGLVRGTELAVIVGRVVSVALVVTGLALGWLQLLLVAVVLWMMGSAERMAARLRGDTGHWSGIEERAGGVEYIPPTGSPTSGAAPGAGDAPRVFVWRRR